MRLSVFLDAQDAAQQVNHHQSLDNFIKHGQVHQIDQPCFVMLLEGLGVYQPTNHYPLASLLKYQEFEQAHEKNDIFLAQPVNLMLQRDTVALTEVVVLTDEEFDAITELLNKHFLDDAITFEPSHAGRHWYLTLPAGDTNTFLPQQAVHQDAHAYQPAGDGARQLKQIMNEAQMLLHEHTLNQKREQKGLQACNSIWLSGNGHFQGKITPKYDAFIGDTLLLKAIHHQTGIPMLSSIENLNQSYQHAMLYTDRVEDVDWLQLYQMVKRWRLRELNIYMPFAEKTIALTLSSLDCLKFWHQHKTFEQRITALMNA